MAENKINSYCAICGKGYHLCVSCKEHKELTPWKAITDTSEHYKIYQVLVGFNGGVYTKDEAKKKFESIDLSDIDELRDDVKKQIVDIIGVADKKLGTTKKSVDK